MKGHAPRNEQMSIAVEDWDDLAIARGGRDERRRSAPAEGKSSTATQGERRAATESEPEAPTLGYDKHEDDSDGEQTGIAVEDWDDLAVARRRRDERRRSAPSEVRSSTATQGERSAATEREPEAPTLGYYKHEDDSYGEVLENLRVPAAIAAGNAVFWLVGRLFGVVELIGVASLVSVALLLAAYVLREWQRDRTALMCLAGALPLPLTIFGLFY